jgi:glucoamylase
MLKVQEDRTYAGALIASLSNPWGDTVDASKPSTGYKAVWPRDFYQCAMALAALGDRQTPLAAFRYLPQVQVGRHQGQQGRAAGCLQKSEVDGTPEWVGVQLDQTAMPIMLGWKLWKQGWLSETELKAYYGKMIKPAADFLVDGGKVDLGWNHETIKPPFTQQERWEEQGGYSPSTTAAVIAGLVVAGDIADLAGDKASAERYRKTADAYSAKVEALMVTTKGSLGDGTTSCASTATRTPTTRAPSKSATARRPCPKTRWWTPASWSWCATACAGPMTRHRGLPAGAGRPVDGGPLPRPLRLQVPGRGGDLPRLAALRRRRLWRGYEDRRQLWRGGKMAPGQRGRVWPIFTGERGHYELALDHPARQAGRPGALEPIRRPTSRAWSCSPTRAC